MPYAKSRPGFIAYPHAVQHGIRCANRAGGAKLSHTEYLRIKEDKARAFNAPHAQRFVALCEAAGGVRQDDFFGDPAFVIPTDFGPWDCRFDLAGTSITANFRSRDVMQLHGASYLTGSSEISGKLGFYTDGPTEEVVEGFERALRRVVKTDALSRL